jgi:hypothetical protein
MNNGAKRARPIFCGKCGKCGKFSASILGRRTNSEMVGDANYITSRAQPAETSRTFRTFRTFDLRAPWGAPVARRPWRRQLVRSGRLVGARAWIEAALGELAAFELILEEEAARPAGLNLVWGLPGSNFQARSAPQYESRSRRIRWQAGMLRESTATGQLPG